jgi:hypothetical protein
LTVTTGPVQHGKRSRATWLARKSNGCWRGVDHDARHGFEVERPQKIARRDEREVMFDLRQPDVDVVKLPVFVATQHVGSDVRLPSFELSSRCHRPQQSLAVEHERVEARRRAGAAHDRLTDRRRRANMRSWGLPVPSTPTSSARWNSGTSCAPKQRHDSYRRSRSTTRCGCCSSTPSATR